MDLTVAYRNFEKIIELSDSEKDIFKSLVEVVHIRRNTLLLAVGQYCQFEYFVLAGCLRSYYMASDATEHVTMFATEGWWTGNLKSFVRHVPSDFYVEILEDTTLLRLSEARLEELFERVPKFERYFRILIRNRLLATQDRVSSHLSSPASERYQRFSEQHPQLEQRIALKHIASFLGITPTYLSRLRRAITNP